MSNSSVAEKSSLMADLEVFVKRGLKDMDSRQLKEIRRKADKIMQDAERRAATRETNRENVE